MKDIIGRVRFIGLYKHKEDVLWCFSGVKNFCENVNHTRHFCAVCRTAFYRQV